MKFAGSLVGTDADFLTHDDGSLVDFLVEEEGGEPCLNLSIDDGEVDGRRTTVLWQE